MPTSILLARLFGISFIVIFSSLLFNRKFYLQIWKDILKNPGLLVVSGLMILICGLLVINIHPIWEANWRGLITILGWLLFLGGTLRILFPQVILKISEAFIAQRIWIDVFSILFLLVGLYLSYVGFIQQ